MASTRRAHTETAGDQLCAQRAQRDRGGVGKQEMRACGAHLSALRARQAKGGTGMCKGKFKFLGNSKRRSHGQDRYMAHTMRPSACGAGR